MKIIYDTENLPLQHATHVLVNDINRLSIPVNIDCHTDTLEPNDNALVYNLPEPSTVADLEEMWDKRCVMIPPVCYFHYVGTGESIPEENYPDYRPTFLPDGSLNPHKKEPLPTDTGWDDFEEWCKIQADEEALRQWLEEQEYHSDSD